MKTMRKAIFHPISKALLILFIIWIIGGFTLNICEENNPGYSNLGESLWGTTVFIFSGFDYGSKPETVPGRIVSVVMLIAGIGFVGFFAGDVASGVIKNALGGNDMEPDKELEDHIVVCSWNRKGKGLLETVHDPTIKDPRPVVVVTEDKEKDDGSSMDFLSDKAERDKEEYDDVFMIPGDPTEDFVLKRANIETAHSVVILADPNEVDRADAKSLLITFALREVFEEEEVDEEPSIVVECQDPDSVRHFERSKVDDIVSSANLSQQLIGQATLMPGLVGLYDHLLKMSDKTNETYLVKVPESYIGKTFKTLEEGLLAEKNGSEPLMPLGIKRGDQLKINPKKSITLKESDKVFVLTWELSTITDLWGAEVVQ